MNAIRSYARLIPANSIIASARYVCHVEFGLNRNNTMIFLHPHGLPHSSIFYLFIVRIILVQEINSPDNLTVLLAISL